MGRVIMAGAAAGDPGTSPAAPTATADANKWRRFNPDLNFGMWCLR
jgi:hypothetical protein